MRATLRRPALAVVLAIVAAACSGSTTPSASATGGAGLAGSSPSGSRSAAPAASGPTSSADAAPSTSAGPTTCALPLIHDTYTGFHIAVPDGWAVSTLGGEIAVSSTPKGTEAVVLYPALQTSGLTPRAFFDQYLSLKEQSMQAAGTPVSIQPQPDNGGLPVDAFTATEGGVPAAGIATVMQLPLASQLASSMLVYVAYWAPTASFPAERDRLAAIAACYGPEPASLFRVFQDQVFTYSMPPDWNNAGESQNSIDLQLGTDADVSFLLLESVSASQAGSSQGLIDFFLTQEKFTGVTPLWAVSSPPKALSNGGTGSITYEEFTGSLGGVAHHGFIYGQASVGGGITSGVIRVGESISPRWNELNAAMIQMTGFIQHKFSQDLAQIQHVNQQFQNFAGQVANFDDVLNSQQLVQDPTTGGFYEAPYSSYVVNGPAGPGYYLPNGQVLNPVQRP